VTLELEKAYSKYYLAKNKSVELCQTHLEILAEAHLQRGNISQEKMLKALRAREAQCATARCIKFLRGKTKSGSTIMATVTAQNGVKKDITDRHKMESAILRNNAEKNSQSSHTPFCQDPLKQEFGLKGLTTASQAVLARIYDSNHNIAPYIMDVIQQCQIPESVKSLGALPMDLTLEKYQSY